MAGDYQLRPIGVIRTPWRQPRGTPIQPPMAEGAEGRVEVDAELADGLADLDGFDRIWLVYWFDRAPDPRLRVTPFMDTVQRGLFATRAPCRPNRIGLSPVRLLRVEGATLHVADVDMLDGSPLLDIKPYAPTFDCFPGARAGWLDESDPDRPVRADDRFE
jgi:tRNA-Thr(GGU) m(6)t(6)A37 methyltransferase TsaA